jgi:hypothetical protein
MADVDGAERASFAFVHFVPHFVQGEMGHEISEVHQRNPNGSSRANDCIVHSDTVWIPKYAQR